jgi:chromosome segregation ATPase
MKKSTEKKLTSIIRQLEKQASKNKKEIKNYIYANQHLTTINKQMEKDNFFLKKFIQDLEWKSDEAHKYNSDILYKLQLKLEKSEQKTKNFLNINQSINTKLNDSENFNKKLKKCLDNTFKKLYLYQKQNDELMQHNKELDNNYNTLIDEYRCFRKDIEQNIEESLPLLNNNSFSNGYQINKFIGYYLANFESAKKIDNKKTNKDNILLLNKTMTSHSKDSGSFPSLLSEIQSFLSKSVDTSQNEPAKIVTSASNSYSTVTMNTENEKLKKTISEISTKLNNRESECDNLKNRLESIKTKLNKMQLRMSISPNKKQEIVSKMIGKTNELDAMKKEYKQLNCDFKILTAEHAKLNQKYLDACLDSQELIQTKKQVNELATELEKIKNELAIKEQNIANYTAELKESQEQLANIKNTYQHANTQSINRIDSYQTMISNMQSEIDTLKEYKQKYADMIKKADMDKENYIKKYQELANESLQTAEIEFHSERDNFQKTLEAKTKQIAELQSRLDELSDLENDLIESQKDNEQLSNEVEELTQKLKEYVSIGFTREDELANLEHNYNLQGKEYEKLISEHDKLIKDYEKLLEEQADSESYIEDMKCQLQSVMVENLNFKNENERLSVDLTNFEKANNEFDEVLRETQTELEAKVKELAELNSAYEFTSATRDIFEAKIDELHRQNESLKEQLNNSTVDFSNYVMKGEFIALEADYDSLLEKYEKLKTTNSKMTTENDSLKDYNVKLDLKITELNTDMDKKINEYKEKLSIASNDLVTCDNMLRESTDKLVKTQNQFKFSEDTLDQYIKHAEKLNKENREIREFKEKSEQSFKKMLAELNEDKFELNKLVSIMRPVYERFMNKVDEYDVVEDDKSVCATPVLIDPTNETLELEKEKNKSGYFSWFYNNKNKNKETTL